MSAARRAGEELATSVTYTSNFVRCRLLATKPIKQSGESKIREDLPLAPMPYFSFISFAQVFLINSTTGFGIGM